MGVRTPSVATTAGGVCLFAWNPGGVGGELRLDGATGGLTVQPDRAEARPTAALGHRPVRVMTPEAREDDSGVVARFDPISACSSARLVPFLQFAGWDLVRMRG